MSRPAEETARLAATVRISEPYGDKLPPLKAWVDGNGVARAVSQATWVPDVVLAYCSADLAEALAEVDALAARCRAQEAVIQEHDDAKEAAYAEVAALRDDRDRFAMLKCCEMAGAMVTALGINPPGEDAVANWRKVCDAAEQMAEAARLLAEWQAAKREQLHAVNVSGEASYHWRTVSRVLLAVEARMLAVDLSKEVGRG